MALLKSGSTVGGNLIWHQGILPLFPTGDSIYHKNYKIYTEKDKPTNSDVGLGNVTNDAQVKKAGDTMTGNLTITNNNANSDANLFLREVRLRGKPTGELLISANNQAIYLRPKGDAVPEQQLLLDTSGTVFADFYRMRQGQQGHADALTRKDYVDGKVTALENSTTNLANTKVAKAGDTMTGNLTVPALLMSGAQYNGANAATRKDYVDSNDNLRLSRVGGSMSGEITWNEKPNTTYAEYITSQSEKIDDKNMIRMFRNYRGGTLWHEIVEQGRLAYYTGVNPDRYIWSVSTGGTMMVDNNYTFSKLIEGDRGGVTGDIKGGAWADWRTRPAMLDVKATDNNGSSSVWKLRSHTGATIAALSGYSTTGDLNGTTVQLRYGQGTVSYEPSGRVKFSHNIDAMNEISMTNGQLFFSLKHTVANNPHIVTKISDTSGYKTHDLQNQSGTLMQWGDFGFGGIREPEALNDDGIGNKIKSEASQIWRTNNDNTNVYRYGVNLLVKSSDTFGNLSVNHSSGDVMVLAGIASNPGTYKKNTLYGTANTSKDTNGFVRTGSKVAVTTDQITDSMGASTTLVPNQRVVNAWLGDRYNKAESDSRYLRMNVTNKTSMPVVYRTANYFDDANQRDLNYAGFYRTNGLNSLSSLMIHIPHSSGLGHARGIGFEYGSSGWSLNTYAYDGDGKYRGAKPIALTENHYSKSETYNRGEVDSRIAVAGGNTGNFFMPRWGLGTSNNGKNWDYTKERFVTFKADPKPSTVLMSVYWDFTGQFSNILTDMTGIGATLTVLRDETVGSKGAQGGGQNQVRVGWVYYSMEIPANTQCQIRMRGGMQTTHSNNVPHYMYFTVFGSRITKTPNYIDITPA